MNNTEITYKKQPVAKTLTGSWKKEWLQLQGKGASPEEWSAFWERYFEVIGK